MSSKRAGLIWVDAQGEQSLNVITTASGVGAIETALQGKSNADIIECWEGPLEQFSASTVAATYPSNRTVAVLLFQDNIGSGARLYIPSPISSIFDSSGNVVDPSQVTSITSAAIGNLRSGAGNAVTMFKGGFLSKAPVKALESTDVVEFVNPMTSTGDMIYSTDNTGSAGRLAIGSTGTILGVSGGIPAWVPEPIGLPITTANNYLSSDVSMPSPNVFVDGPSLTLAAGDWYLSGAVQIASSLTSGAITAKLWDGTNVSSSGLLDYDVNGDCLVPLTAIVHPSTSTTYKISAAATAVSGTSIKAAARLNGAGNTASYLLALKIG